LVTSIAGSKLVLGKLKLRLANCNRASWEARGENTEMNVPTKAWSSPLIALSQGKEPPPQDRFAKLDAMRVHYQNYGEGRDAIVFIHGWLRACKRTSFKRASINNTPGRNRSNTLGKRSRSCSIAWDECCMMSSGSCPSLPIGIGFDR
jgi:hypothetical protein